MYELYSFLEADMLKNGVKYGIEIICRIKTSIGKNFVQRSLLILKCLIL
jgi:hypothetical protein